MRFELFLEFFGPSHASCVWGNDSNIREVELLLHVEVV